MPNTLLSLRNPFTKDLYTAESAHRIRVERANSIGYFDENGCWIEGSLRSADPCFCRFLSSSWIVWQNPAKYGLIRNKNNRSTSSSYDDSIIFPEESKK